MPARSQQYKQVLNDPHVTATTVLTLAADVLGPKVLQWDPETVSMEMEAAFGVVPRGTYNKLMAAIELVTTDVFYRNVDDFIRLCNTLYNGTFDPREFDPADAAELSWGITEALLIWPPDHDDERPFADDILGYIGHAIREEGIMQPPDVLRLGIINDQGLWTQVQGTFSDDPVMFNAIYDVEREKTDEINAMVKHRLGLLLQQMEALNLEHGETAGAVKDMLAAIQRESKSSDKLKPALGAGT